MTENLHIRVRKFLQDIFNDEELTVFCFDYFPQIYNDFTTGMTKSQKVLMLVKACQRNDRMPDLMAALERERPNLYRDHFTAVPPRPLPTPQPIKGNPRQIFISYAHQDADFAWRLAQDLRDHGWEIWMALDSIRPGEKWVEAINRGLAESGVFVLVLTEAAVNSRWVQSETNVAIGMEHRGELRLLPLDVAPTQTPPLWRSYQWIPFRDEYKAGLEALMRELEPERIAELAPLYQQLQQASVERDWPTVQELGRQIEAIYPDYRDVIQLVAQATQAWQRQQEQQARLGQLYLGLHQAIEAGAWQKALELGQQIQDLDANYRDTAQLLVQVNDALRRQEQEADLARRYRQLQAAASDGHWDEVLDLGEQIQSVTPGYQDVQQMIASAKEELRQERIRKREQRYQQLQEVLAAVRNIPVVVWGGGIGVLLLVIFLVLWWPNLNAPLPPRDAEAGDRWTRPTDGMVMVYVPPPDAPFVLAGGADTPQDGYWIDKYEVSNAQYQLCVDAGECVPSAFADEERLNGVSYPVVGVSWSDAAAYSAWVGGTLPTGGEWEYAAVGDSGRAYPWGNEFDGTRLNFCDINCPFPDKDESWDDGYEVTAPVGSYPAGESWVGAADMAGNVQEWTASWYDKARTRRMVRGGAWTGTQVSARAAYRLAHFPPNRREGDIGFRVVVRRPPSQVVLPWRSN